MLFLSDSFLFQMKNHIHTVFKVEFFVSICCCFSMSSVLVCNRFMLICCLSEDLTFIRFSLKLLCVSSSRECQVQHWLEGHKYECHTLQACGSPSSSEGGARKLSDLLSPRSSRSDVGSEEIVAPSLSPTISAASSHDPPAITNSAPVSPLSRSLLKTSSTVSADGRRVKPKKVCPTRVSHYFNSEVLLCVCFDICGRPAAREKL